MTLSTKIFRKPWREQKKYKVSCNGNIEHTLWKKSLSEQDLSLIRQERITL